MGCLFGTGPKKLNEQVAFQTKVNRRKVQLTTLVNDEVAELILRRRRALRTSTAKRLDSNGRKALEFDSFLLKNIEKVLLQPDSNIAELRRGGGGGWRRRGRRGRHRGRGKKKEGKGKHVL